MKFLLALIAATALCGRVAMAQTMKVYQGQVITAIPAATADDILFENGGTSFTVMGSTFQVSTVDQILFDHSEVTPATVRVDYAADGTWITVSGDVAPQLQVAARGSHVSVLANPALQTELRYVLGGTSTNGSFFMDGEYKAKLELNNLNLTNPDSAAINIANGKRIDVILPSGTASQLADGANGLHKACFFINGHAEFKGGGSLSLVGNSRHAYASDEYTVLTPTFGQLQVTHAVSDGMHIDQYFQMDGGNVNISGVQGDCIDVGLTKNAADLNNGQAFLNGGDLTLLVAANDTKGLKTEKNLTVTGGHISANVTGLGTKGFSVGTDLLIQSPTLTNPFIEMNVTGGTYMPDNDLLKSKCRGIKVKGNFTFDGGKIRMNVDKSKKAKGISVDGTYTPLKGDTNVNPE